jgi:hypothetical protein
MARGGVAALPHGLAAVYMRVSVAWGQRLVAWADARFAHRFAGGPPPPGRVGECPALLGIGMLVVGDFDRTWALLNVAALWTLVLAIDFVVSFSYELWPRQARET